jgi:enamine deaminase RidA (YjgF/YER057c/UK114 family)
MRPLNPARLPPPLARYSHGIEVPAGARLVATAGQLGITREGSVADGVEAQAEICFDAIRAILNQAGMDVADIVKLTAYVSGQEHVAGYMKVRNARVGEPPPASTLIVVSGFARAGCVVEVEALAARVE